MSIKRIGSDAIDSVSQTIASPVVTGISRNTLSSSGGETIQIYGSDFQPGISVYLGSNPATTVTRTNSTSMSFTVPPTTPGTYSLYVVNPNGGSAVIPINVYSLDAYWTPGGYIIANLDKNNRTANVAIKMDSGANYSVISGSLPGGITFNANTLLISGNVANIQIDSTTYSFTLQAYHTSYNTFFQHDYAIVYTSVYPTWTTTANLGVITEAPMTATVTATSDSNITYSLLSSLPTGLSLNSNSGVISGSISPPESYYSIPTTFDFSIRATDAEFNKTDKAFSLTYNPTIPAWVTSSVLSQSYQNYSYTQSVVATGYGALSYSLKSGTLPTGLSLSSAGVISGTPTVIATYNFTIEVTDTNTHKNTRTFTIVVNSGYVAAEGGNVSIAGGYKTHTFTTSTGFTVTAAPPGAQVSVLLVAGGGGGGCAPGGGGGAGGYLSFTANVEAANTYSIVVGAGGPGATSMGAGGPYGGDGVIRPGTVGSSSSAFGNIAVGGGYGAAGNAVSTSVGGSGGSGGGGTGNYNGSGVTAAGGAGTSGQGYAGGTGGASVGGGGGGGSQAGQGSTGGNGITLPLIGGLGLGGGMGGGTNTFSSTSWGGGTGGTNAYAFNQAGLRGGGNGTAYGSGGGGGGGGFGGYAYYTYNAGGGAGYTGVVVIRYPFA